jgi:hypothetical protein
MEGGAVGHNFEMGLLKDYPNMVCPANSSYSFRATALIFCRMFIHIMEVCMFSGF